MGHAGSNKNGYTVWLRFKKACETCHKKYSGDKARYAIEGIARRQFGDDMTLSALRDILAAGEFWKLDIQSQRAQHMRAVTKQAAVEEFDILLGGIQPQERNASQPTVNLDEAVPF
jgi:hypothetical protein